MPIEFTDEQRKQIIDALRGYVLDEFDDDIGDLRAERLFEFVMNLVGASVYNQALTDAQAWMQGKLMDLEGDLHQTVEFDPQA